MTKRELSEKLKGYFPELEDKDLAFIVDQIFDILALSLKKGITIELRDFGVFKLSKAKSYLFKNPKNQQNYYLKGKVRAVFQMGKELRERLNTPFLASFDLGTQTFRMLLGKYVGGEIYFLQSFRENVRLGEGLVESGKISEVAMARAFAALQNLKAIMDKFEVRDYYAVGTAVFRKAENASLLLEQIEEKFGLKIEVLTPEKEAELTLEGILFGLKKLGLPLRDLLIVDLGGGSTEFIFIREGQVVKIISLDIGVVALRDLFKLRYPVTKKTLQSLKEYVRDQLKVLPMERFEKIVITGGSASLLGSLDLKLTKYDPQRLHGHKVSFDRLEKHIAKLSDLTLPRIRNVKGMEEGREDIALPGLVVYSEILNRFGGEELIISEFGILEASLLSLLRQYNK